MLDGTYSSLDPQTCQPVGYNVEFAQDLARRLGVKFDAVDVTPPNRVQYTKERVEILSHVPTPFEEIGGSAMVHMGAGVHDWNDLRGKPVCISQSSNYTRPLIEQTGAQVKGLKGMPEVLLALRCAAGRAWRQFM